MPCHLYGPEDNVPAIRPRSCKGQTASLSSGVSRNRGLAFLPAFAMANLRGLPRFAETDLESVMVGIGTLT